ncbi:MAG TPA: lytic transglycosylase F [Desulfobulbaceae bacterium]|nr:lytic transglycosylase F [Desulfobulbaceae bacterium]
MNMKKSIPSVHFVNPFLIALVLLFFLIFDPWNQVEAAQKKGMTVQQADNSQGKNSNTWARKKMRGDYPAMVKRRIIRALVPPSKTFFFIDKGQKRGLTYDALVSFEKYINKQLKNRYLQVKVVVVPTSRKHLIEDLQAGYGDIAAGNLTITAERSKRVDFAEPGLTGVDEIIVSAKPVPVLKSIFDLSGRKVYVRPSSSYYDSLRNLNKTLVAAGKKPVQVETVDEYLEDEDLLEMMNVGLIPMIVIDSQKGQFWARIFKNIILYQNIKLRTGGKIAWAVRKDTPKLKKVINGFIKKNKKGTLTGNILYNRYLKSTDYVHNNVSETERKKYKQTVSLFKKYAHKYDFPYLLLMALAYQESGLDQKKRSHAGAIGIMQVLPRTAADKHVGIKQIDRLENNIHAGSKYLQFMKKRYFSKGLLDELNSDLFTIAAYNAGPARIAKLRKEAKGKGFDPNVWFNNVEVIAARRIGRETVQYVGNIYKYYVAYKLIVKQERVKKMGKDILKKKHKEI